MGKPGVAVSETSGLRDSASDGQLFRWHACPGIVHAVGAGTLQVDTEALRVRRGPDLRSLFQTLWFNRTLASDADARLETTDRC